MAIRSDAYPCPTAGAVAGLVCMIVFPYSQDRNQFGVVLAPVGAAWLMTVLWMGSNQGHIVGYRSTGECWIGVHGLGKLGNKHLYYTNFHRCDTCQPLYSFVPVIPVPPAYTLGLVNKLSYHISQMFFKQLLLCCISIGLFVVFSL